MENYLKSLCFLFSLALPMLNPCLSSEADFKEPIQRTAVATTEASDIFDSYKETVNDKVLTATAKKEISGQSLSGYDTVSLFDNDYTITYELVTDSDSSTVTLNVYFEGTKEKIIENFTGVPMTNYNDEKDLLFDVDGQRIFLSEMSLLTSQQQCSLWGNILHKAANLLLMAVDVLEPAVKFMVYASKASLAMLYLAVKNADYAINYAINSSKTQPNSYIYRQDIFTDWKYGFNNVANAGCAAIAGYNLAYAKGLDYSLADVIFMYEGLGIELGTAQGYLGTNPYQVWYFLKAIDVSYTKVILSSSFKSYMEDSNDYYIILNEWNGEEANDGYHTFFVDKDCSYSEKFHAYNYWGNTSSSSDYFDYSELFHGSLCNTFICAYLVSK